MIEKLKRPVKIGGTTFREKINELVDVINVLQAQVAILEEHAHPTAKVDHHAEEKKWIGKVCRFWDDDKNNSSCGILTSIDTETFKEPQFVCNDEYDYEHCEPVSPEDDIIYKKD